METPVQKARVAFERGLARAQEPVPTQADGLTSTGLRSYWLHDRCRECGHSFRPDDPVQVNEGTVVHAGGDLDCRGETPVTICDPEQEAAFYRGLYRAWPQPQRIPDHRLRPGDSLVAGPLGHLRRANCAVCAHTLREGDTVVICPCSPEAPRCQLAIHRDPLRGLNCWHYWSQGVEQKYCPATSKPLAEMKRGAW